MPSTAVSADGDTRSIADRTGNAAALGTDAFERRGRLFYWVDRKQRGKRTAGNSITVSRGPRTQMTTTGITKSRRGLSRRALLKATAGTAALARRAADEVSRRRARRPGRRARSDEGHPRLHRPDRRLPAGHRQGEGLLRQARHARRRGRQAGLLGRHPRQPRARLREQRHRRRAHPDADALPDLDRQGDAEQRADADVHPGAAQSRRAGDLGRATNTRTSRSPPTPRRSRPPSTRRRPRARK